MGKQMVWKWALVAILGATLVVGGLYFIGAFAADAGEPCSAMFGCEKGAECMAPLGLSGKGKCLRRCTATEHCDPSQVCESLHCLDAIPVGEPCKRDSYSTCEEGTTCVRAGDQGWRCHVECRRDEDCDQNERCSPVMTILGGKLMNRGRVCLPNSGAL